jgi:hypothetical protein
MNVRLKEEKPVRNLYCASATPSSPAKEEAPEGRTRGGKNLQHKLEIN